MNRDKDVSISKYLQELDKMPALDINLINQLGRDLHSGSPGYMGQDEVCPWTLFLTMALTLLKG